MVLLHDMQLLHKYGELCEFAAFVGHKNWMLFAPDPAHGGGAPAIDPHFDLVSSLSVSFLHNLIGHAHA